MDAASAIHYVRAVGGDEKTLEEIGTMIKSFFFHDADVSRRCRTVWRGEGLQAGDEGRSTGSTQEEPFRVLVLPRKGKPTALLRPRATVSARVSRRFSPGHLPSDWDDRLASIMRT